MRSKVVVVGSSNTDMVVKTPSLPTPGETVLGGDFIVAAGGKGANQAVAAARLGSEVCFVGKLGRDMFGDQSVENFKKDGIVLDFLLRDETAPSGVALIMVDSRGENMISVASGANSRLSCDDVRAAEPALSRSSVLLLQLEIPMETVRFAARMGSEAGLTVILNPAPAQELDDDLLKNVSILTPNATEAAALTGIEPTDEASALQAAKVLRAKGVGAVVITLGEMGAFLSNQELSLLVPTRRVEAVDTTAAGDAFNGALAHALASGKHLKDAVSVANRVAALSVTRFGAQPSLPFASELD